MTEFEIACLAKLDDITAFSQNIDSLMQSLNFGIFLLIGCLIACGITLIVAVMMK